MNKEYIEKLLKEQREMCCQYLKDEFSLSERICESLKYAPSPVIDLSGVTNDGMPALPDGLNDDSNVDYNFKVGWIACWKAFTQSGQQAPEPVEEKKECEIGICWAEAVTNINGINVCGFHANQQL
jgi:hypothetical protein